MHYADTIGPHRSHGERTQCMTGRYAVGKPDKSGCSCGESRGEVHATGLRTFLPREELARLSLATMEFLPDRKPGKIAGKENEFSTNQRCR